MPDFTNLFSSITAVIPDLVGAFVRGGQYALALFVLLGSIYFLRRYL